MDNKEFNAKKRVLNKEYAAIFGTIPCMQDYSCTREEYLEALKTAIQNNCQIDKLLKKVGKPINNGSLT